MEEALKFVELEGTLEKFPSELSGGMRRRAAIARAVVTQPPLLLYDSPTAGLDPITAHTIMALIIKERDLNKTTALIVTYRYQDGNLVANFRYNPENGGLERAGNHASSQDGAAPRTLFMVLREGRLIFEGPQTELEASKDPYISKFVKQRVIEHAGAQQSPLVAVEGWGGGVCRHGDPGGADLPADRKPRHLPAQRDACAPTWRTARA